MQIKNMSERIIFLKRSFYENKFGEQLEKFTECGRGWAAIKFKMTESEKTSDQKGIIYQITLQRPIPLFHRLKWRNVEYQVVSEFFLEPGGFMVSFLIRQAKDPGQEEAST